MDAAYLRSFRILEHARCAGTLGAIASIAYGTEAAMLTTTTHSPKSHPHPMGFVPRAGFGAITTNRLVRADFSRDARLLDASIAGVVLSFNPRNDEMRAKAERSWETIQIGR